MAASARQAFECCTISGAAGPAPHSASSLTMISRTSYAHAACVPKRCASPCRGRKSTRNNESFCTIRGNNRICSLFMSSTGGTSTLRRNWFPLAAVDPHGSCSLGECLPHFPFGVLAMNCEPHPHPHPAMRLVVGSDGLKSKSRRKSRLIASAEKKKKGGISFGDQLLDYIEGGPKLRRWYGAPEQLPKDGSSGKLQDVEEAVEEEVIEDEVDVVRDAVLVTDADSETGQLVVLELILRRLKVIALVKDLKAAIVGFGAYVQPVEGDVNDRKILRKIIRGVRAIICPAKVGQLADQELVSGVEHVVLLSTLSVSRNLTGLGSLFGRRSKREAEENEAAVSSLDIPYTIIRAGSLNDERRGDSGFRYGQGGEVDGTIRREDAAYVCVEALDSPPQKALVFEVVNGTNEVENWSAVFASMKEGLTG